MNSNLTGVTFSTEYFGQSSLLQNAGGHSSDVWSIFSLFPFGELIILKTVSLSNIPAWAQWKAIPRNRKGENLMIPCTIFAAIEIIWCFHLLLLVLKYWDLSRFVTCLFYHMILLDNRKQKAILATCKRTILKEWWHRINWEVLHPVQTLVLIWLKKKYYSERYIKSIYVTLRKLTQKQCLVQ